MGKEKTKMHFSIAWLHSSYLYPAFATNFFKFRKIKKDSLRFVLKIVKSIRDYCISIFLSIIEKEIIGVL